jgi:hypothetical protein
MAEVVPINPDRVPVPNKFFDEIVGLKPNTLIITAIIIIIPNNNESFFSGIMLNKMAPTMVPKILPVMAHCIPENSIERFSRLDIRRVRSRAETNSGPGIRIGFSSTSNGTATKPRPIPSEPCNIAPTMTIIVATIDMPQLNGNSILSSQANLNH